MEDRWSLDARSEGRSGCSLGREGVMLRGKQKVFVECAQARTSLVLTSGTTGERQAGCSKRPSSKAAASEEARRTLRYVEPLSAARTKLADFFSILLGMGDERAEKWRSRFENRRRICATMGRFLQVAGLAGLGEE